MNVVECQGRRIKYVEERIVDGELLFNVNNAYLIPVSFDIENDEVRTQVAREVLGIDFLPSGVVWYHSKGYAALGVMRPEEVAAQRPIS